MFIVKREPSKSISLSSESGPFPIEKYSWKVHLPETAPTKEKYQS
jgi:hypothetical protein